MERPNNIIILKGTTTSMYQKSFPRLPGSISIPIDNSFSSYSTPKPSTSTLEDVVDDSDQISVFDAENYFKEGNESKESKRMSTVDQPTMVNGYGRNYRTRSFNATPTASSEASWNSQVGLLTKHRDDHQSIAINLNRNIHLEHDHGFQNQNDVKRGVDGVGSSRKWLFCMKCPCVGKKSIQVQANKPTNPNPSPSPSPSPIPSPSPRLNKIQIDSVSQYMSRSDRTGYRINNNIVGHKNRQTLDEASSGFSFPVLMSSTQAKMSLTKNSTPDPRIVDDPRRDSLEVFHPSNTRKQLISSINFPPGLTTRISTLDEDIASDASSDLFEIESFSTHTTSTHPLYRRRDSLEEARTFRTSLDEPVTPSVAPTECYEPSEASIDWSVTTAEGFDRLSIANFSDIDMEVRKIQRRNSSIGGILSNH